MFFIVLMIGGMAGGTLGYTGLTGGGGDGGLRPESRTTPTPEATPLLNLKTYQQPAQVIDPAKQYFAVIETAKGRVRMELLAGEAPQAVNSFVFLAREGFYNGLTFFRVTQDPQFSVAQAGDPTCDVQGQFPCTESNGPGYTVPFEANSLSHEAGTVALATRPGSEGQTVDGGQFYIVKTPLAGQDGKDTVFGRVVEGLDIFNQLTPRNACLPNQAPSDENPCELDPPRGDEIISITIEEV